MTRTAEPSCCVCRVADARALVEVTLPGGTRATLCGSHALIYRRFAIQARSVAELRLTLGDRRRRSERRTDGDELGQALSAAFAGERRAADRRRA
jgi:hypothetical protein